MQPCYNCMYTYEIDERQETSPIAPALPTTAHRRVKPRIMRSAPGSSQYNRTARGAQVACPGRMLEPSSARWPRVASAMRTVHAIERARGFVARSCRIREPDAQHIAFLAHVELNVSVGVCALALHGSHDRSPSGAARCFSQHLDFQHIFARPVRMHYRLSATQYRSRAIDFRYKTRKFYDRAATLISPPD